MLEELRASDFYRFLLRFVEIIGAILIVLIFVVFLMTAIAQQEVVTRLKDAKLNVSYTTALSLAHEADAGKKDLDRLQGDERRVAGELPRKQSNVRLAERKLEAAWQDFLPLVQRFAKTGACTINLPSDDSPAARTAALGDFEECASSGTALPPQTARKLEAAQAEAKAVHEAIGQHATAVNELSTLVDFLDGTREQIKTARAITEDQKVAQAAFSDTGVLTTRWLLIGTFLVGTPPAMLQILLTFISGLFGALLLTLILIVYPDNLFHTDVEKHTKPRIILGGMIALCVYIVILGSTAVLGSNSGLAAAGTNYMALCAIGILAGMFSDRVAGWLSDQADAFFRRKKEEEAKAGDQKDGALPENQGQAHG